MTACLQSEAHCWCSCQLQRLTARDVSHETASSQLRALISPSPQCGVAICQVMSSNAMPAVPCMDTCKENCCLPVIQTRPAVEPGRELQESQVPAAASANITHCCHDLRGMIAQHIAHPCRQVLNAQTGLDKHRQDLHISARPQHDPQLSCSSTMTHLETPLSCVPWLQG